MNGQLVAQGSLLGVRTPLPPRSTSWRAETAGAHALARSPRDPRAQYMYLPGAIGHRAAVSEHRESFAGGAGDAAGPNSLATHPASVRTAISGIKQMLYGNFY